MCYSIESSLKTSYFSLISIIWLLSSKDVHYKWLGITLIGWCLMQFAELLLWLTLPENGCTNINKILTMTLIPFILVSQPICSLFGSLYVIPWAKSSYFRKGFLLIFPLSIIIGVAWYHFYKAYKICTTVTPMGHLYWATTDPNSLDSPIQKLLYFLWPSLIILPFLLFWDKSILFLTLFFLMPIFGYWYGLLKSDSQGSIWCYFTSYSSLVGLLSLFIDKNFNTHLLELP
jgi:hypothetical protein